MLSIVGYVDGAAIGAFYGLHLGSRAKRAVGTCGILYEAERGLCIAGILGIYDTIGGKASLACGILAELHPVGYYHVGLARHTAFDGHKRVVTVNVLYFPWTCGQELQAVGHIGGICIAYGIAACRRQCYLYGVVGCRLGFVTRCERCRKCRGCNDSLDIFHLYI